MNYKIEDNFDFYNELNNNNHDDDDEKKCMISHLPLTYNSVTLSCGHIFNYMPLYNEFVLNQDHNNIKCPYCRIYIDKLLFYLPLPNVKKIYGVNYPLKMCMPSPKCNYKLKFGKNKGLICNKNGIEDKDGILCEKHREKVCEDNKIIVWTQEKEKLFKTSSVSELKIMLKKKGLKVTGLKKDLVNRLVIA